MVRISVTEPSKPERRRRVLDRSRSRNSPRAAWRKGKNSISSVR